MNPSRITPWTVFALMGLAALGLVDQWRGMGSTDWPIVRGSLPNMLAVPTLTFGFLMMRFPERTAYSAVAQALQAVWFWRLWISTCIIVIAWEYLQLWGNLVYDPTDVYATAMGALVAVGLYLSTRRWAFQPASS